MFGKPGAAYESSQKATSSGRELEAAALFKAARQLEAVKQYWDTPDRDVRLLEALRYNQRLWTIFQVDLERPDHGLPVELRQNLLRLAAFIARRSFELLSDPDREKLQALIDIDRNIASGLASAPAETPAP
ncbi:MAG: flagellar biosynthesis regulator FlaF [Candidatus Eisenbacteria bacterium]